jgi:hypothetical protein
MTESAPNPGTPEAIALSCSCPVIDNGYGKGWMVKDENGDTVFVYTVGCKVHSPELPRRSLYVKEEA